MGRTYYYEWTTGCDTCNYTGSVQAVNSIGTGSAAGGGQACALSGYLISSNNCSGYTKYDLYTNGSCGSYSVTTENNSTYCGYNPCAGSDPSGTYLGSFCSGYTLIYRYSNGCYGEYNSVAQYNSSSCGYYDPCAGCAAYGTFLYSSCDPDDYRLYSVYANGCCGVYQITTDCSAQCGC